MWRYHLFKKESFCLYHRLQAASYPGTSLFHLRIRPYAKLPLYFGNKRVISVLSLLLDNYLDVGPRVKNACSWLRSRLKAVIATEGYF